MAILKDIKDEFSYFIDDSDIHGKGVFAKENIGKGKKCLCIILTDEDFLYSDLGKYVNHSKSPNCKLIDGGNNNFFVVTLKDINSGEELVADYDKNPWMFQKSDNLGNGYFDTYEVEEIEDDRFKYRYFTKLNENIRRIKELLF